MTQDQSDVISIILGVFFFVLLLAALLSPRLGLWVWGLGLGTVALLFLIGVLADGIDALKARRKK